ncbi:MAG: toll/interleukin-1 receptor domain-containing protein [Hydrogenophaga sp.]|uniref:toll/interleukin-1 receptor domain-containing protein n=1 Tax=Hydrogenophaga sp. TaxID=1904254 RepID=UPI003D9BAC00
MNRIFISYRSSDGKKDAARLTADLNERFGEQLVFYDKQDLVGGSSWRDAINATLGSQPVVLVLITPDLLGAQHPEGGRRVDREDDPIRGELLTARHSGAVIIPLLTDGMQMPVGHSLPAPLQFLGEAHARPLRTDDWNVDLQRIVDDLQAHHIAAHAAPPPAMQPLVSTMATPPAPSAPVRLRWLKVGGAAVTLLVAALLVIGLRSPDGTTDPTHTADTPPAATTHTEAPQPASATPAVAAVPDAATADAAGVWWAVDAAGHRTRVQITLYGAQAVLQTDAIPVAWYPEWQAYAQRLREQGTVFDHIRYAGSGQWANGRLQIPFDVRSTEGHGPLDTGALTLTLSADGRELTGQLWSNGDQTQTPLRLVRRP